MSKEALSKPSCVNCSCAVKRDHFEMLGLSFGENKLGMPLHLIKKLPAIYCSANCLLEHLATIAFKSQDKRTK